VSSYEDFVAGKLAHVAATGIPDAVVSDEALFPHQRALTQWALRRGRSAIFAAMGLGKSRMALTWADRVQKHTGRPVIILTPLAVAQQMQAEGHRIGIESSIVRNAEDVGTGVNICNYERLHKIDASVFGGVVCDESGCIKGIGSKTLSQLRESFGRTPFILAATATPSPNSWDELCQHAELLGVAKRSEALAEYFDRDGGSTQDWDLKGHARRAWWRFVASWGALVRSPNDLGFDGSAYELPPLEKRLHFVESSADPASTGRLFLDRAGSLLERRAARKASLTARIHACASLSNDGDRWVVWCDYNEESTALTKAIDGAVEVTGSMDIDAKERALMRFIEGDARVLVSKPSLCGHGVNLQFCNKVAFAGISDSYEQQFQAIGRCHRFGQSRPVQVHMFLSESERSVLDNIRRKEADAMVMGEELARETADLVQAEVCGTVPMVDAYNPRKRMEIPAWISSDT
jgi:superfamily II DNA or RNA helicase